MLSEHIGLTHKFCQDSELVSSRLWWPNCHNQPGKVGWCFVPPWGRAPWAVLPLPTLFSRVQLRPRSGLCLQHTSSCQDSDLAICAHVLPTKCQWCSMCSPNPACYLFCKRIEFRIYMPNFPLPHPGIHRTTSVGFDQLEQFPVHFPAWEEIHPGNAFRESCRCTLMLPR